MNLKVYGMNNVLSRSGNMAMTTPAWMPDPIEDETIIDSIKMPGGAYLNPTDSVIIMRLKNQERNRGTLSSLA